MYYVLWSYVTKVNRTLQAAVVTPRKYILRQSLARNLLLHVTHLKRLLGRDFFFLNSGFLSCAKIHFLHKERWSEINKCRSDNG